jgi:hypothetical protein
MNHASCLGTTGRMAAGLLVLVAGSGCGRSEPNVETPDEPAPLLAKPREWAERSREWGEQWTVDTNQTWQTVKEMYDRARESGEDVPPKVKDWVAHDIKKIGAWEYRILTLTNVTPDNSAHQLNELGSERWECFWVQQDAERTHFYLKKVGRSYLKLVPKGDLLRLLAPGGGGE